MQLQKTDSTRKTANNILEIPSLPRDFSISTITHEKKAKGCYLTSIATAMLVEIPLRAPAAAVISTLMVHSSPEVIVT
jgi:hypothetical protein